MKLFANGETRLKGDENGIWMTLNIAIDIYIAIDLTKLSLCI